MKTKFATASLLMGALLLPVVGYSADKAPPSPASPSRSDQPIDDSVITTKVKALYVKDKQVSAMNVEVKTVNGVVELRGTAKSRQEADQAVALARGVQGVKSVKNDIQVAGGPVVSSRDTMSDKDRPAKKMGRSDQPIDDSVITTKVKASFAKDKQVSARSIEVKTVNGVVELGGTAKSRQEASRAVSLARKVKGVKSVKNDIQVAGGPAASSRDTMSDKDRPAKKMGRSDQPIDDSVITTKVKALYVKDKQVSAMNVEVKTVNGVVELGGTAKSRQEADQAVALARGVQGVKSVKNNIQLK